MESRDQGVNTEGSLYRTVSREDVETLKSTGQGDNWTTMQGGQLDKRSGSQEDRELSGQEVKNTESQEDGETLGQKSQGTRRQRDRESRETIG